MSRGPPSPPASLFCIRPSSFFACSIQIFFVHYFFREARARPHIVTAFVACTSKHRALLRALSFSSLDRELRRGAVTAVTPPPRAVASLCTPLSLSLSRPLRNNVTHPAGHHPFSLSRSHLLLPPPNRPRARGKEPTPRLPPPLFWFPRLAHAALIIVSSRVALAPKGRPFADQLAQPRALWPAHWRAPAGFPHLRIPRGRRACAVCAPRSLCRRGVLLPQTPQPTTKSRLGLPPPHRGRTAAQSAGFDRTL